MANLKLAAKLFKFQQQCPKIVKGENNPFYKSKYAELSGIVNTIFPILEKLNLMVIQPIVGNNVVTKVIDIESGETEESTYPIITKDATDPQKFGAGVTYARRYAITAILGIVTEDDDDGNTAATKPTEKPAEKKTDYLTTEKNKLYNLCLSNGIQLDTDNLKALGTADAIAIMKIELTKKGVKY
jgi:hypothetical protein